jgi:hypothetical protein
MAALEQSFSDLRAIMLAASDGLDIARDEPGYLEVRTFTLDPKTRKPGWFGMVKIGKAYVAYHLPPLYQWPELNEAVSPLLAKRKQGMSCFNFRSTDAELIGELAKVTAACRRRLDAA